MLQLSYVFTLPTVKISVILFYHRIFPQKSFRWAIRSVGAYLVLFLISGVLVFALQCHPVRAFWQPDTPHHCIYQVKFYTAHGVLNLLADLAVVLMPIPLLWRLKLPRHQKIGLVVLFLSGGL